MSRHWAVVATYAGGLEADIAVERLKSVGILAVRRDNDTAGLFGPGFQGASARGVTVLAPAESVEEACEILGVTALVRSERSLQALWEDPAHWNRDGSYRCADDPRLLVPKRGGGGWTLNMSHRRAQTAMWIFLLAVVAGAVVIGVIATRGP